MNILEMQNCLLPGQYMPTSYISASAATYYPLQIREVENGFIVLHSGNEFVFSTPEALSTFIVEQLKKKK